VGREYSRQGLLSAFPGAEADPFIVAVRLAGQPPVGCGSTEVTLSTGVRSPSGVVHGSPGLVPGGLLLSAAGGSSFSVASPPSTGAILDKWGFWRACSLSRAGRIARNHFAPAATRTVA